MLRFKPAGPPRTGEQAYAQSLPRDKVIIQALAGTGKTATLACCLGEVLARQSAGLSNLVLTFTDEAKAVFIRRAKELGVPELSANRIYIFTFAELAQYLLQKLEGNAFVAVEKTLENASGAASQALEQLNAYEQPLNSHSANQAALSLEHIDRLLKHMLVLKYALLIEHDEDAETGAVEQYLSERYISKNDLLWAREYERIRSGGGDCPRFRIGGDEVYDLARLIEQSLIQIRSVLPKLGYVFLDEMHDLNPATFTILRAILKAYDCKFIGVGDPFQEIYEDSAASADYMRPQSHAIGANRNQDNPWVYNTEFIPLTVSFRFGVRVASAIRHFLPESNLKAFHRMNQKHDQFTAIGYEKNSADPTGRITCAQQVLSYIQKLYSQHGKSDGTVAIIFRSPQDSIAIETELMFAEINYRWLDFNAWSAKSTAKTTEVGHAFPFSEEIMFARALLCLSEKGMGLVSLDIRKKLVACLNEFFEHTDHFKNDALESTTQFFNENNLKDPDLVANYIRSTQYYGAAIGASKKDVHARMSHYLAQCMQQGSIGTCNAEQYLADLMRVLDLKALFRERFVREQRVLQAHRSLIALQDIFRARNFTVDQASSWLQERSQYANSLKAKHPVVLTTVDMCKGTEFDHVIIPNVGVRDNPLFSNELPLTPRRLQIERHRFYVACTRAKDSLGIFTDGQSPFGQAMLNQTAISSQAEWGVYP
jgi:DNA helicase-2/ATP-dependent DNA helicase PcrA